MLGGCVDELDLVQDEMAQVSFPSVFVPSLQWWLILFIEARVLSPNI